MLKIANKDVLHDEARAVGAHICLAEICVVGWFPSHVDLEYLVNLVTTYYYVIVPLHHTRESSWSLQYAGAMCSHWQGKGCFILNTPEM